MGNTYIILDGVACDKPLRERASTLKTLDFVLNEGLNFSLLYNKPQGKDRKVNYLLFSFILHSNLRNLTGK